MEGLVEEAKSKIGAIITKPKMTDKLLNKPPFRFLHDTISAIVNTTGFAEGLYTPEEKDSSNITERDAKMGYLNKMIACVGICVGGPLEVRPAKIVAGQEADLTCKFLIALADCATNPAIDVASSVSRTLAGEEPGSGPPALKSSSSDSKASDSKDAVHGGMDMDAKGSPSIADAKGSEPVVERGMSRGGNRNGRQSGVMATAESAGLSAPTPSAINLDAEIDQCDGTPAVTQQLLGPLITRPKLTEKLLGRPPFKFLHDIVLEVQRQTGFSVNLFAPEEMESSKVTDKEQKIAFLEKIIMLVGIQLQTNLTDIKPLKIIQGLEANATNRFLQCMAVAAKHAPDSTNAVRIVLDQLGGTATNTNTPSSDSSAVPMNPPEPAAPKTVSSPMAADDKGRDARRVSAKETEPAHQPEEPPHSASAHTEGGSSGGGDDEPRSMRPTTARRRPPKVKDGAKEVAVKDIAPSAKGKKAEGILVDGQDDDDEEDLLEDDDTKRLADELKEHHDSKNADSGAQSKIVQDIQNRRMEQEALARGTAGVNDDVVPVPSDVADEKPSRGIRIGSLKKTGLDKKGGPGGSGGSSSSTDIEKMRNCIQLLVKCTGPLGSCMDFIQEDISLMNNELKKWEEESRKYEAQLEVEKARSEEDIKPLQNELTELEEQIKDEMSKISSMKASIARNENSIQQILKTIVMA